MSWLNEQMAKMKNGILRFVNATINANRDMPFHDYYHADETATKRVYLVGDNNINQDGDQRKRFVSKSTLIFCTEDTTIYLNSNNNILIVLLADTYYEFKSNIYAIHHAAITQGEDFYAWFEGTLPQEARSPE